MQGLSSLATPSASSLLRATGRIGLYGHANGIQDAYNSGTLPGIQSAFSATGPVFAELALCQRRRMVLNHLSDALYNSGLNVSEAAVDVTFITIDPASWQAYIGRGNAG